ncbi:Sensor histidine kinase RcsC [Sphingomonas sp. S2M10]|jgi:FixJ family two-component response regulator|uniref:response regulator transcription factor n=1 Tax=Sphingomonas sp. S2M10 TaxID=2705010 RepID=UPI00145789F5|nr:response regulator [Sphingomonas sp. S2M10]NLS25981.1 Sensor histidine kinase RcsC [Sphingomonas sp. S2M10]
MVRVRDSLVAVVDDDALVRDATASLVRSFGYRTAIYPSADAYLDAAADAVACVLTDLQMPGRSGLELRECLRARGSAVPVILMTAFPTEELRARTAALDLVALLDKPVDPDLLSRALARALGG